MFLSTSRRGLQHHNDECDVPLQRRTPKLSPGLTGCSWPSRKPTAERQRSLKSGAPSSTFCHRTHRRNS
jgi:hypothetical protein